MEGTFEIYWDDLNEEVQKNLYEFLGGNNGNYDLFPIAIINPDDEE